MKYIILSIFLIFIGCSGGSSSSNSSDDKNNYVPSKEISECNDSVNAEDYEVVEPPEDMEVFLVIGQSNASGRAALLFEDMEVFENIYLLIDDSNNWIKARNSLNEFSNIRSYKLMLSFIYSFAKELEANYPGQPFGIISNARGGTKISQWQKGNICYECTMDRILIVEHEIIAVLVHQGESDYNNPDWLYFAKKLITDTREEIGYSMPFIFGELVDDNLDYLGFNQRIYELPHMVDDVYIVSSEGLTWSDIRHFDREGQLEFGVRYFDVWEEI